MILWGLPPPARPPREDVPVGHSSLVVSVASNLHEHALAFMGPLPAASFRLFAALCMYVHVLNRMVYVRIVYVYVCMYVNERLHGTKLECTYVAALARRKIPDIVRILMQAGTAPW